MGRRSPWSALLGALLVLGASARPHALAQVQPRSQTPARAQVVLIRGATVYSGAPEAEPSRETDVLIRGERIAGVGRGLSVPEGAEVLEARGAALTPGLLGTGSPLGLMEVELEPGTRDDAPAVDQDVRAAFDAADGFNPRSTLLPLVRAHGITTAVATPTGALVSGTSALVDLRADDVDAMVSAPQLALHVDLMDPGLEAAGGTRGSALSRLRQALSDARLYGQSRAAFDRRAVRELSLPRADLERLLRALEGPPERRLPVVVRVARASDILRVLELAREYGLRLVLAGAQEAWVVADRIAQARVPVILQPLTNLPTGFSALGSRADNAALLHAAGVPVAITTDGPHRLGNLRQEAGNAVARGLPHAAAVAALTSAPAAAFGVDADYGTIAPGKLANLVLWSGEPLELSSRVLAVFVRGARAPLSHRQQRLFERYRQLPLAR